MPLYFNGVVAAHLAGDAIGLAILCRFSFGDAEQRLMLGSGRAMFGGEIWSGLGEMLTLSQIPGGAGDTAQSVTFTFSGVDDAMIARAVRSRDFIEGYPVSIALQFLSGDTGKPLDSPQMFWSGTMDRCACDDTVATRSFSIICEGELVNRSKPPAGLLSHTDQDYRSPGDMGLEFVNSLLSKSVPWPKR